MRSRSARPLSAVVGPLLALGVVGLLAACDPVPLDPPSDADRDAVMVAATEAIEADGLDVIASGLSVGGEGQDLPGHRDDQGALDDSSISFDGIDRTITTAYISCRGADGDGEVTLEGGQTSIGYRFRCSRDGTTDRISDALDVGTGRFVMRVTRSPAGTIWAIVAGGPPSPAASPSSAPPSPFASSGGS